MKIDREKAQKKLGKYIREVRAAQGFSQEELAYRCGVHRTYMGAIERGERNISLLNILRISKALKIKSSELLSKAGL